MLQARIFYDARTGRSQRKHNLVNTMYVQAIYTSTLSLSLSLNLVIIRAMSVPYLSEKCFFFCKTNFFSPNCPSNQFRSSQ